MNNCWDDPAARARLLQAIRDEPRCTDHTCLDCNPPKELPVLSSPYTVIKTAAAILMTAIFAAVLIVMVLG